MILTFEILVYEDRLIIVIKANNKIINNESNNEEHKGLICQIIQKCSSITYSHNISQLNFIF